MTRQSAASLGPWGPYGFNSGVTQEDVSREDAAKLGVFPPDTPDPAPPASLTDGTTASTRGMDPDLKRRLLDELRSGPEPRDIREVARNAAAKVRGEMLTKGLQAAEQRGDDAKSAKYRAAIAILPPMKGLIVREDGDKIVLETSDKPAKVTPDERDMASISLHTGGAEENPTSDSERTAEAVRTASRSVLPEWTVPSGSSAPGSVADRAVEAQITAASEGRKPLYYEPWGNPDLADQLAAAYRQVLPSGVAVESKNGFLYIYRPEAITGILDSDPSFYRRTGESDFDSISRVSEDHSNGELLGYGARGILDRPAHLVRIYKGRDLILYFFVSSADAKKAANIANERTEDFNRAFGWPDLRYEIKLEK